MTDTELKIVAALQGIVDAMKACRDEGDYESATFWSDHLSHVRDFVNVITGKRVVIRFWKVSLEEEVKTND